MFLFSKRRGEKVGGHDEQLIRRLTGHNCKGSVEASKGSCSAETKFQRGQASANLTNEKLEPEAGFT